MTQNANVVQNQEEYQIRYDGLTAKYDEIKEQYDNALAAISAKKAQSERLDNFIKILKSQEEIIKEFDSSLWGSMVEYATVDLKQIGILN
ncbi:MAG: hypothetical protein LIO87_00430 [Eubacterium sp.]|nr:hypothetical protein [Eubacterium sp.]